MLARARASVASRQAGGSDTTANASGSSVQASRTVAVWQGIAMHAPQALIERADARAQRIQRRNPASLDDRPDPVRRLRIRHHEHGNVILIAVSWV
jgi:hypothetical protein